MRNRFASTRLSCRSRLHPRSPRSGGASRVTGERGQLFSRAIAVITTSKRRATFQFRANDKARDFFSQRFFFSPPEKKFRGDSPSLDPGRQRGREKFFFRPTVASQRETRR